MFSCFKYNILNKKKVKVKPFSNITPINVYENKFKIRNVVPKKTVKPLILN